MSEGLRITTFGGLSIQLDGELVSGLSSRKVGALLVVPDQRLKSPPNRIALDH